jgi:hypothetical protein
MENYWIRQIKRSVGIECLLKCFTDVSSSARRLEGVSVLALEPSLDGIDVDGSRAFNFGEFVNGKPKQKVPRSFANHIKELADFEERCSATCHRIFRLLAMGLEVCAFNTSRLGSLNLRFFSSSSLYGPKPDNQ